MKTKFFMVIIAALGALSVCAVAQNAPTIKRVEPRPTVAIGGKTLFRQYCAACHGADGKGSGPAASAMKLPPTDLTQMERKNGGRFPEDRFMKILDGTASLAAHGAADMPVWGPVFHKMGSNEDVTVGRMHELMNFIESIQAK